ncbi:hypothetical protein F511_44096 [Dorcoceras hygrometricum]|uniref:Retrotransposon gag domain-containing protein n=1 Tax=Dorcoceras hygrometricum TaxID=472368 RepID=A0A2Z6ZYW5_9LAMI|nr:hypothetical protein F511_44096 [Dorcoceras hygrometricum]
MDGATYHWFHWIRSKIPDLTWGRFAEELIKRYGGRRQSNPFLLLASMKQGTQPLDTYIEQFEVLLAQVGDLPDDQCLGYFISGLREEISRKMAIHEPRTIMRAMDLARAIEEEINGQWGQYRTGQTVWQTRRNYRVASDNDRMNKMGGVSWDKSRHQPLSNITNRRDSYIQDRKTSIGSSGGDQKSEGGSVAGGHQTARAEAKKETRIISPQEFQRRKEKGLCFRCGEAYSPLHKCAFKLLQVAIVDEETKDEGEIEDQCEHINDGDRGNNEDGTLDLPLFSISGVTQPQTLKLRGRIQNEEVVVMIDSGASHNFVSRQLLISSKRKNGQAQSMPYFARQKSNKQEFSFSWQVSILTR